jgi:hypothetical protein
MSFLDFAFGPVGSPAVVDVVETRLEMSEAASAVSHSSLFIFR